MLMIKDVHDALKEGKELVMFKYKYFGRWSAPKKVSAEVAYRKSMVRVFDEDGVPYCPYGFELA